MINPFTEKDGTFSWRKTGTAICFAVFATACIGFLITHNFDALPNSYQGIIGGVFVFYFGKRMVEGIKISNNGTA